jgi:DNA-binding IclR family transcriptional regulator
MSEDPQSTLLRGVRVLFGLAEAGKPMTVTKLAAALALPTSTTHRILNVLREAGFVMQDEDGGSYSPGPAFLKIATMLVSTSAFPRTVDVALRELVEGSGESAFYGAYLGETGRLRFVANLRSHHAIQYVLRTDVSYSLLWGASGRAVAAWLPKQTIRSIYEREKASGEGVAPLPEWEGMWQLLQRIRHDGFAESHGQRSEGSHAIAAPVLGAGDAVMGCIGISMPIDRRSREKTKRCVQLVTAAGTHLGRAARSAIGSAMQS